MNAFVCLLLLSVLKKGYGLKCYTCTIDQGVIYDAGGERIKYCLEQNCRAQCVVAVLEPEPDVLTEYRLCYSKVPGIDAALPSYENVCNFVGSLKGEDCRRSDVLFCDDQPLCNVANLPTRKVTTVEPPVPPTQEKKWNKTPLVIGGSAGGIVVLLLFVAVAVVLVRKLKYNDGRRGPAEIRIDSVIHQFEVNETYMTMEEIEELEVKTKKTGTGISREDTSQGTVLELGGRN
ncbi:uncharacterized protein LOC134822834 [Bolinopsis microptera]|uniref:uncharacterized protein LOC134822834 n=1 Tax=Bolinopsis microptera TaxID=2820187 RepID=UPI0030796799